MHFSSVWFNSFSCKLRLLILKWFVHSIKHASEQGAQVSFKYLYPDDLDEI